MTSNDFQVLVVGCGPVGAFAANALGRAGLRTMIVERELQPYALPRAGHLDHEMMRLLQSVGLSGNLLPMFREAQGHIHFGADKGVIRYLGTAGLPKRYGWANDYFFYQPELEQELRQAAERYPNVEIRVGTPLVDFEQREDGVAAVLQTSNGDRRRVTAHYVIACDGANSFVRKTLNVRLADMQFDEPWLVVDAAVDGPIRFTDLWGIPDGADLQSLSVMMCDPARPATLVPGRGNHRRWEFMLLPGESDEKMMEPDRVRALVAPWLGGVPHQVVRAATYRFHGLIAESWRVGSVFLAGDAAHQTPPFFGQGMCHGLRDIANLAWKLKLVVDGKAGENLLATYQPEREPHVRAVIAAAIAAGRYICELDPQRAQARDIALRQTQAIKPGSASDLIPPLNSGISSRERKGVGQRFIQPIVSHAGQNVLLDAETGGGFVLLSSSPDAVAKANTDGRWNDIGGRAFLVTREPHTDAAACIVDSSGDLTAWLKDNGAVAVVIRPDFYVYGFATSADDVSSLMSEFGNYLQVTTPS
jgi:3-(3-hydroxy-phenyl)propionate hydroxylase